MISCVKCGRELAGELFCPICGQRTHSQSTATSTTSPVITQEDYAAFIGEKAYLYLPQFNKFNVLGVENYRATWLWPAFFFGPFWMFYRKLYLWGLGALFLSFIPYIHIIIMIASGMAGYFIYYKHAKAKILALRAAAPLSDISQELTAIGGVHKWILKVYIVLGILIGVTAFIMGIYLAK